jgi:hypothetical protein
VGLNISPDNDGINGFSPRSLRKEFKWRIISAAGNSFDAYNVTWDNKWYSKVVRYKDKWIVEGAIPSKAFDTNQESGNGDLFDRSDKEKCRSHGSIHLFSIFGSFA